jgi:hypothetical protein
MDCFLQADFGRGLFNSEGSLVSFSFVLKGPDDVLALVSSYIGSCCLSSKEPLHLEIQGHRAFVYYQSIGVVTRTKIQKAGHRF